MIGFKLNVCVRVHGWGEGETLLTAHFFLEKNERARVDPVKSECADRFLSVFFFKLINICPQFGSSLIDFVNY